VFGPASANEMPAAFFSILLKSSGSMNAMRKRRSRNPIGRLLVFVAQHCRPSSSSRNSAVNLRTRQPARIFGAIG
jgi:hypothetical protein